MNIQTRCRMCGGNTDNYNSLCSNYCSKQFRIEINMECIKCGGPYQICRNMCVKDLSCYVCNMECHVFDYKHHKCGCSYCYGEEKRDVPLERGKCKKCGMEHWLTSKGYCSIDCESHKNN